MLGGPALADQPAVPKESRPLKGETWDEVSKDLGTANKRLEAAVDRYIAGLKAVAAKKPKAEATLESAFKAVNTARQDRAKVDARLAETTRPTPANPEVMPEVERAEKAYDDRERVLFTALDGVDATKPLKPFITKVEAAHKARLAAAAKVQAAWTKANRRPRATGSERPVGRGFVLG